MTGEKAEMPDGQSETKIRQINTTSVARRRCGKGSLSGSTVQTRDRIYSDLLFSMVMRPGMFFAFSMAAGGNVSTHDVRVAVA